MNRAGIWRSIALIFLLAFFARLFFVFALEQPQVANDAVIYHTLGKNIAEGRGYVNEWGAPSASREPGYPLFVAAVYSIFGTDSQAVRIAQALLGALSAVLTLLLAQRLFGAVFISTASALLVALYPRLIYQTGTILTEPFFLLLILAGLMLLERAYAKNDFILWLMSGLVLGLTALTRASFLPMGLVMIWAAALLAGRRPGAERAHCIKSFFIKRSTLWRALLSSFALVLVLSPWVIRNQMVFGEPILRFGGADTIWSGSYVPWDGDWLGDVPPLNVISRGKSGVELERFLYQETWKNIKQDPLGVALVWLKKPWKLWGSPGGERFFSSQKLIWWSYRGGHLILVALAIFAAGILYRAKKNLALLLVGAPPLLISLVYLPFNAEPRYAAPFYPYLFILAMFGLNYLAARLITSRKTLAAR